MKLKLRNLLLGIYDLGLSIAAIITGNQMIHMDYGIFREFPLEWSSLLPFHSWLLPGIFIMIVFGLGNMTASLLCFMEGRNKAWKLSMVMGMILTVVLLIFTILVKEWYLASNEILILGILQLFISRFAIAGKKHRDFIRNH